MQKSMAWPIFVIIFAFFVLTSAAYMVYPVRSINDSRWSVHTAISVLNEGNTELSEFLDVVEPTNYYAINRAGTGIYNMFPIGVVVTELPIVAVVNAVYPSLYYETLTDEIRKNGGLRIEGLVAALVVAATATLLLVTFRAVSGSMIVGLLVALTFAFATSAWSVASRQLWQHGPSMLYLTLAFLIVIVSRKRPGILPLAGLAVAAAYATRPTNSISVVAFTLFVAIVAPRKLPGFFACATIIAIPFIWYSWSVYGAILPPYYTENYLTLAIWPEAAAGNLFSPSRGLFVFSPVLLLCFYGVWLRRHEWTAIDTLAAGIVVVHWFAVSLFEQWWGGYSVGPRFMTDILPFACWFLVPVYRQVLSNWKVAVVSATLLLLSVLPHYWSSTIYAIPRWNAQPESIDATPYRLWDYSDPMFLRRNPPP